MLPPADPPGTRHYRPESTLYIRGHRCFGHTQRSGQMRDDTHPPFQHHTASSHCPVSSLLPPRLLATGSLCTVGTVLTFQNVTLAGVRRGAEPSDWLLSFADSRTRNFPGSVAQSSVPLCGRTSLRLCTTEGHLVAERYARHCFRQAWQKASSCTSVLLHSLIRHTRLEPRPWARHHSRPCSGDML